MNKIYEILNEKTNGKFSALRFPRVVFGADRATVTVVCKADDRRFVDENRSELEKELAEACGFNCKLALAIDDIKPTAADIKKAVAEFTRGFPYAESVARTIKISAEPPYSVTVAMHRDMYELASKDYIPRLKELLANSYAYDVTLDIKIEKIKQKATAVSSAPITEYALKDVIPVIGDLRVETARSVASLQSTEYNITACGIFAMPTEFLSKGGRRYEKFLLCDGGVSLSCRLASDIGGSVLRDDLLNRPVCIFGNVEYDTARNEASVSVRELSLCRADGLLAVESRPPQEEYERVLPEPYTEYVQAGLFDAAETLPDALKGEFVVFDFETTGLSVLYDKPTELGAVKISNGKITEIFSTLINPCRPIPPDVAEKTGITDEMVKDKPVFEDIIGDFYKFSYGCSFVCHNITFDFPFLLKCGTAAGYCFTDRRTYDTMGLAPAAIPGINKLSLEHVLEELGMSNANAHRAWADAAATAKAFVAMQKIIAEKR